MTFAGNHVAYAVSSVFAKHIVKSLEVVLKVSSTPASMATPSSAASKSQGGVYLYSLDTTAKLHHGEVLANTAIYIHRSACSFLYTPHLVKALQVLDLKHTNTEWYITSINHH